MSIFLEFVFHDNWIAVFPDIVVGKKWVKQMMSHHTADTVDLYFGLLCGGLKRGRDTTFGAMACKNSHIATSVQEPLKSALHKLFMLQAYKADNLNQEAFTKWGDNTNQHKRDAMAYFLSIPLYGEQEFKMTPTEHKKLIQYAVSTLDDQGVVHAGVVRTLVTNIMSAVCASP